MSIGSSYNNGPGTTCYSCTGEWRVHVVCRVECSHIPSMQCGDSKTAMVTPSLSYLSLNLDLVKPFKSPSLLSREIDLALGWLI